MYELEKVPSVVVCLARSIRGMGSPTIHSEECIKNQRPSFCMLKVDERESAATRGSALASLISCSSCRILSRTVALAANLID